MGPNLLTTLNHCYSICGPAANVNLVDSANMPINVSRVLNKQGGAPQRILVEGTQPQVAATRNKFNDRLQESKPSEAPKQTSSNRSRRAQEGAEKPEGARTSKRNARQRRSLRRRAQTRRRRGAENDRKMQLDYGAPKNQDATASIQSWQSWRI